jgi:uncharacterized protein
MFKSLSLSLVLTLAAAAAPALAADPTPHQVYEAARNGHLAEAQQMINQVLRDHPQSGEAHYVAAQVSARSGNLALARQELATAQRLAPGLPFADENSVQELQRQLQGTNGTTFNNFGTTQRRNFPWGWLLLLLGGGGLLWSLLRRRAQQTVYRNYPGGPTTAQGTAYGPTGPGYGPGGPNYGPGAGGVAPPAGGTTPGRGSGLMGGLATGLAAGAGLAAGEELVHRLGDRNSDNSGAIPSAGASEPPPDNPGMGGNDFGVDDGGSSNWDDGSSGGGGDFGGGGGDDWT